MSEYQYYDFQKVDGVLSESECKKISQISSRAVVTPRQAIFNYSYGDFRGDPEKVLANYFDIMLYATNWGTKQLVFRFPKDFIDVKELSRYCISDVITTSIHNKYLILSICINDEESGGGWIDEEGTLDDLLPIWKDLLKGDYRSIYLAWLRSLYYYDDESDENKLEPPVPANLKQLSYPLKRFIEFFEIDKNLIEAAASISNDDSTNLLSKNPEKWIAKLPEEERNQFLLQLLKGELNLDVKLSQRLKKLSFKKSSDSVGNRKLRTIEELLKQAEQIQHDKEQKTRRECEQSRIKELNELARKETEIWNHVIDLIKSRTRKGYEHATKLLIDLKDLAHHTQKVDIFSKKISQIRNDFRRLSSLMTMLRECKIIE